MPLDLDALVGQPIRALCANGFTADSINHCAHFVSHALNLDFSYSCREHTGGSGPGANIRVHELFARCPLVGPWSAADTSKTLIIFVTRTDNVDLARKEMVNHPQKHVGIYRDGVVYHYSNTNDRVVRQDVASFYDVFERIYAGPQGLYFGLIPGSDLDLDVDLSADRPIRGKAFRVGTEGGHVVARTGDEPPFYVGTPVRYHAFRGLYHAPSRYYGPVYRSEDYDARFDHWATVIEAIGHCEGGNHFNLINTYDRAACTFGFLQFAAHTPEDNLILLFRELLRLPEAKDYFPELELRDGRVHRVNENGSATNLEHVQDGALQGFMRFLNPNGQDLDDQEMLHAARLIHWANTSPEMRAVQVQLAVRLTSEKMMRRYHRWYDLSGTSDVIATLICDIHHQGRASRRTVEDALGQVDPVTALLRVNHAQWRDRNERLEQVTRRLVTEGKLGKKVYDPASNGFLAPHADRPLVAVPPLPPTPVPLRPPAPPSALRIG